MAFSLDFSSVPSSLPLPTIPTSAPGASAVSKTMVDKITSSPGSLFSNPMAGASDAFSSGVNRLENMMKGIAANTTPNQSITQSQAASFLASNSLQDMRSSMGNFMMHTGRLSGLAQSHGIQAPGLSQIMSIGTQMQSMMTLLEAGKGCLPVMGGCTSLFSQDAINGNTGTLNTLMEGIEKGTATVADIADKASVITNSVKGIIAKDSAFLTNCVNQLQQAALGLALESLSKNPCARFIMQTISNKNPGGVMDILAKPLVKLG